MALSLMLSSHASVLTKATLMTLSRLSYGLQTERKKERERYR